MSLPRTLLKRGIVIYATIAITLRFALEILYVVLDPRIR
jgi:ABC-type dipeptide/oligopeptide/nickel transport system permease component